MAQEVRPPPDADIDLDGCHTTPASLYFVGSCVGASPLAAPGAPMLPRVSRHVHNPLAHGRTTLLSDLQGTGGAQASPSAGAVGRFGCHARPILGSLR